MVVLREVRVFQAAKNCAPQQNWCVPYWGLIFKGDMGDSNSLGRCAQIAGSASGCT